MSRPLLLDLFCGAGGAAMGYSRAGFDVVGVDIVVQPHYPFPFIQGDALNPPVDLSAFDAIHASPPCQAFSDLRTLHQDNDYPDLVEPIRDLLKASGKPYVIENVEGAPLSRSLRLCGSAFGLGVWCHDGVYRQLRRHRWFETDFAVLAPSCRHIGRPVGVYGYGGGGQMTRGYKGNGGEYRVAMGIDWATKAEIAQAVPPAYTQLIGEQLLESLTRVSS